MIRTFALFAALLGAPSASSVMTSNDMQIVKEFTIENYGYGDDGIDCEIEVGDLKLLTSSGGAIDKFKHRLYSFNASQEHFPHGCGIQFSCFALIKEARTSGAAEVEWANCELR